MIARFATAPAPTSRISISRLRTSKVTLFVGLYAVVVLAPTLVIISRLAWQGQLLMETWWFLPLTLFCVLATVAPLMYLTLVRRLEGRLLRDQRRHHRTLIAASSGMTRIKEIERLCRLIVYTVNGTVRLANTCLFLFEPKEQRYVLRAVRYQSQIPLGRSVDQNDPLVKLLQEEKDLVVLEELQAEIDARYSSSRSEQIASVYSWMRGLEAKLIVPSFSNDRLLAFLVLGAKSSDESYTTDDIALFSMLANQAALAIENAMFFEELRANEAYIIQSEKLASLGQLASGMAHEIHNPLTIISGEAQLYLERFKGQDAKVDGVLMSIIEECRRAADITRRILRFAKPAPADVAQVNLRTTVEEALTLASYQVRMDRFECVIEIDENLPKVKGNLNQIQEVLLNLILNACQAMGEQGGKLILSGAAKNSEVILKVADTGPGIPPHALRKVFDPFYTTKSSGTGLGLFVTQRIIKAHNGSIELESVEGKGACFVIRLPAWHEDVATASKTAG